MIPALFAGLLFRHGSLVKDVLAAAGGALLGALFTGFVLVVIFKAVRVRRIPRRTTVLLSLLGGIIAGWLAWNYMGGGGFGWGSGTGTGSGDAKHTGSGTFVTMRDTGPASTAREPADTLRIVVVRSKDYEPESKRYFLIEGRSPTRNLAETVQVIKDRQQLNPGLKTVEVAIYTDSITEKRGLADELEEAVRPLKLTVTVHKLPTATP